jgi:hypothetical protein
MTFCRATYEVADREKKVEAALKASNEVGVAPTGRFMLVRPMKLEGEEDPMEAYAEVELRTVRMTVSTLPRHASPRRTSTPPSMPSTRMSGARSRRPSCRWKSATQSRARGQPPLRRRRDRALTRCRPPLTR